MSVGRIINLVVVVLIAAIMLPVGINALIDVDTSGWPTLLVTVFEFLPIIVGIVFLIGLVAFIRGRGMGLGR